MKRAGKVGLKKSRKVGQKRIEKWAGKVDTEWAEINGKVQQNGKITFVEN